MKWGWRIKCKKTRTYYVGMVAIGPCFGGTREKAQVFRTKHDALVESTRHSYGFAVTVVESPKGVERRYW